MVVAVGKPRNLPLEALATNAVGRIFVTTPTIAAPVPHGTSDLGQPWVVNKDELRSRSKNTPFDESKTQGRVLRTLVAGNTVYQYGGAERV